jgi:hypothetical protein
VPGARTLRTVGEGWTGGELPGTRPRRRPRYMGAGRRRSWRYDHWHRDHWHCWRWRRAGPVALVGAAGRLRRVPRHRCHHARNAHAFAFPATSSCPPVRPLTSRRSPLVGLSRVGGRSVRSSVPHCTELFAVCQVSQQI